MMVMLLNLLVDINNGQIPEEFRGVKSSTTDHLNVYHFIVMFNLVRNTMQTHLIWHL